MIEGTARAAGLSFGPRPTVLAAYQSVDAVLGLGALSGPRPPVLAAYQWVDAMWVQGLGVPATAAVTSSVFVMWSVYSLNDIFAIGVTAYVSQLIGAGDRERAGVTA